MALTLKSCAGNGYFSGYASIFNTADSDRDIIKKGAFLKSLAWWKEHNKKPKMLWQHNLETPIGVWEEIYEDLNGLFVKGRLLLDLQKGREAYSLLKEGVLDSLSIGFRVNDSELLPKGRLIKEIDLQEISLVTFGAHAGAKIHEVKAIRSSEDYLKKILNRLENLYGSYRASLLPA